uniref:Aspartate aminotransferase n=1 Tax=Candidatus Kentrum sp. LPFa TaxID=2126335 RepID=A0A450WM41_9GAMM|nr:MAG: aspartate aminotransferase [Candidatus Kentron sp. LPFa]
MKYIKILPADRLEFQMFVLDDLADELLANGKDVIKVTIGISELPIPEKVQKVFSETLLDHEKTHLVYPEGLPELRQAITEYYDKNYGVKTTPNNVFVNVGTSAVFRNIFQLTGHPGSEILLPRPYYCLYLLSAILTDATIKHYEIDLKTGGIDFDSFSRAFDPKKTSVIVINSPGNPLGNIIPEADIARLNDIVAGQAHIIHDEIYNNVVFYDEYKSPLIYLDKHLDTQIITNAFSKGFRMYTKRVGYAIVPDSLMMPMRIMQQHTLLTSDPVNQYGMIEALKDLASPRELMVLYRNRAEYSFDNLKDTGCNPIKAYGGFYVTLDCDDWIKEKGFGDSKDLARDILEKVYVATVPSTDFGIPNGLRLSFCNSRYNEAIDRLRTYFTEAAT